MARSAGCVEVDGRGLSVPSVQTYSSVMRVGAVQSGGVEGPSPAPTVVQANGVWRGPEKTGPSIGWSVTLSVAVEPPTAAEIEFEPSDRPVTTCCREVAVARAASTWRRAGWPFTVRETALGWLRSVPGRRTSTMTWPPLT